MLLLIQHLPVDSPFKLAFGDRELPLHADIGVGTWNEIKAMRGDLWAFLGNEHLPFNPVLRPSEQQEAAQQEDVMRGGHDAITAQLRNAVS